MQDLTFGESGEYYYYPAIRADGGGNLIAVFNRSSTGEYVGVYASGQPASAPNTFQMPVPVKAGEAPYTISPPRWGDYSGASLDPSSSTMVWIAGEYSQVTRVATSGRPGSYRRISDTSSAGPAVLTILKKADHVRSSRPGS